MAIMCCAAPLPLSHHRRSRTVDSYFHVDLESAENGKNEHEQPAVSTISLDLKELSPVAPRSHVARPAHLRDTRRSKSVDFHANVLAGGHRRSKSYKISSSTLASLYSGTSYKNPSTKPKAARKAKKGVKFGQVHSRGFNLIVSENPNVTSGLGIEFGWEHCTLSSRNLDEYEQILMDGSVETKRSNDELLLSRKMRNRKLVKYGNYSEREIFLEERKREMSDRADFFHPVESFDM